MIIDVEDGLEWSFFKKDRAIDTIGATASVSWIIVCNVML